MTSRRNPDPKLPEDHIVVGVWTRVTGTFLRLRVQFDVTRVQVAKRGGTE